jgi:adenosine deaminase
VTNRLIEAGLLFGCMGYLTLTAPHGKEKREFSEFFNIIWTATRQFAEERQLSSFKGELGDNFRSLYLLPSTMIERLREERIGVIPNQADDELAWLHKLPKADLHCHLGGAFDAGLIKELGAVLLDDLIVPKEERLHLRGLLEEKLGHSLTALAPEHLLTLAGDGASHCLAGLKPLYKIPQTSIHLLTAVLVDGLSLEQIEQITWHEAPKAAGNRLDWYMACGDLGGSSLLQSRGTLRLALRWLLEQSVAENLGLLEVRFSPDNYTRGGLSIPEVIETLLGEAHDFVNKHDDIQVHFLVMATRHKEKAAMAAQVAAAVTFGRPSGRADGPRITGFDLAGQEQDNDPIQFQELFMPLHHHFMNITIHAGEMAEDDKIWQALYLLHAKRIGHGLKLVNNERMMGYVRDYGIAIEMCPSSNIQTNGFRYGDTPSKQGASYPLKQYLDFGLAVTINTDNRGISRTTMSNEYLEAARLTEGGLSRWEILRLVKNSFKAAFLPKDKKDTLLKKIDTEIFNLILDDFFPEAH